MSNCKKTVWYQPWFSVTQVRENEVTTVKHGHLTHTKIISASVSQAVQGTPMKTRNNSTDKGEDTRDVLHSCTLTQ
jgi:hypothetical protein